MTEADQDLAYFAKKILEHMFCTDIEYGIIEVGNRSTEDIIDDFSERMAEAGRASQFEESEIRPIFDHRGQLLERARIEASEKRGEIAITLYATWLEHFVNGMLELILTRRDLEAKSIRTLIRELRLTTKATALWELVGLPPLDESDIRIIERTGNLRNAFVHYKWQPVGPDDDIQRREQMRQTISDLEMLIAKLLEVEHVEVWCSRREELISAFREHLRKHEEAVGPYVHEPN